MLIKNETLDSTEFKKFFSNIEWTELPRKLGPNHSEFFYMGKYEDEEKIITISVRPSLRMQLSESFKGRTLRGEIPSEGYKGELCDWGSTVEVVIPTIFLDKIKETCKDLPTKNIQVLEW